MRRTVPRVIRVGPGRAFAVPSAAARAAGDGDIVEIEAPGYEGDVATWVQSDLVIRGVGGRPCLRAVGGELGRSGIWVLRGRDTIIENMEFCGARAATRNGAGICLDGVGLTVRHCYVHDND